MIDRKVFFAGVRSGPFPGKLSADQVRGMSEMLDVWVRVGFKNAWFPAVSLANVYRETGGLMLPVREGYYLAKGKPWTDERARAFVKRQGYKYAAPATNGHVYYGRGRIQNTWEYNYKALTKRFGYNFHSDPDAILTDSKRDAEITVIGHIEGLWSSGKHPLSRYLDKMPLVIKPGDKVAEKNLIESRRGVNGLDHAAEIAGVAKQFYADLVAATT